MVFPLTNSQAVRSFTFIRAFFWIQHVHECLQPQLCFQQGLCVEFKKKIHSHSLFSNTLQRTVIIFIHPTLNLGHKLKHTPINTHQVLNMTQELVCKSVLRCERIFYFILKFNVERDEALLEDLCNFSEKHLVLVSDVFLWPGTQCRVCVISDYSYIWLLGQGWHHLHHFNYCPFL